MPTMDEVRARREAKQKEKQAAARNRKSTVAKEEAPSRKKTTAKKTTAKKTTEKAPTSRKKSTVRKPSSVTPDPPSEDENNLPHDTDDTGAPLPDGETEEENEKEAGSKDAETNEEGGEVEDEEKPAPKRRRRSPARVDEGMKLGGMTVESVTDTVDYVKALIYGIPGAGKTYLAGTAAFVPEMCPILWFDIEGGTKTIRNFPPQIHVVRIKPKYRKTKEGLVVTRSAWQVFEDALNDFVLIADKYKTIVIDTSTELYDVCMMHTLVMEATRAEDKGREKHDVVPEQRDYGIARSLYRRMLKQLMDLDMHIILTAHEVDVKDQKSGAVKVMPSYSGKLTKEVPAKFDEVYYLYTKPDKDKVKRFILTQPEGKYYAKTRSGDRLPLALEAPTMEKLLPLVVDQPEDGKEKASA